MKFDLTSVPIPENMRGMAKDERGYVIPWYAYKDLTGKFNFEIIDEGKRQIAIKGNRDNPQGLCPLCGKSLFRKRWFVAGPMAAFNPNGLHTDSGMHRECAIYALRVCPWLANPNYSKRAMEKRQVAADENDTILIDRNMPAKRPPEDIFVLFSAVSEKYGIIGQGGTLALVKNPQGRHVQYILPIPPFKEVELWQHGKSLPYTGDPYLAYIAMIGA